MAAIPVNLIVEQGADFEAFFTVTSSNNVPLNLTGFTADAKIKKSHTSSSSTNFGVVFLNRLDGKVKLTLGNSFTRMLKSGRYVYDLVITSNSGVKTRVAEGIVTVSPGVT
jgi:hypothetical protein